MNAGVGYEVEPREFCEIVETFKVLECDDDGVLHEKYFHRDGVEWVYRKCLGWQPGVITRVQLTWKNLPNDNVLQKVKEANQRRKSTQPLNWPSCGSTFKNPPGDHAGRLIEAAGLKGLQIGGIQISEKHANFLINRGGGLCYGCSSSDRKNSKRSSGSVFYFFAAGGCLFGRLGNKAKRSIRTFNVSLAVCKTFFLQRGSGGLKSSEKSSWTLLRPSSLWTP